MTGPLTANNVISAPAHGTTYEMRPESTTLGVDLQIGLDGNSIDLSLDSEIAHQLRNSTDGQDEALVNLPVFRTQRGRANISVISGNSALLGVHSVRNKTAPTSVFTTWSASRLR